MKTKKVAPQEPARVITEEMLKEFIENFEGTGDRDHYDYFSWLFPGFEFDDLTEAQEKEIWNNVFICNRCGWVHNTDECWGGDGEQICFQCASDDGLLDEEYESVEFF